MLFLLTTLTAMLVQPAPPGPPETQVVFMEPDGPSDAERPSFRQVTDSTRIRAYLQWLDNPSARIALDLFRRSVKVAGGSDQTPYYVALVPQGNHAAGGFELIAVTGREAHPTTPYIKLEPNPRDFQGTFLHETGHVVLRVLNDGEGVPARGLVSIPHTVAALTDRGTAFNEGFASHLEAVAAHFNDDSATRNFYDHRRWPVGVANIRSEYHRQAIDPMTFAQTYARYALVRENAFAFGPAFRAADYHRAVMETSRDYATLRDANQLLQSEGFYATFFLGMVLRGGEPVPPDSIPARYDRMLTALRMVFSNRHPTAESPFLVEFTTSYMAAFPAERAEVLDLLLDLSHGVFVDPQAAALWRAHYLGALRLDLQERKNPSLEAARVQWHDRALADPSVLSSRLGPQLDCEVGKVGVRLVAFGESQPLAFDLNTVEEGVIRLIPGISDREVHRWLAVRAERPFRSFAEFRARVVLTPRVGAGLRCPGPSQD